MLISAAVSAGCDNAFESLSMGEWRETGTAVPPVVPENGDLRTRPIQEGIGEPVQAGDLVKLTVVVLTPRISPSRADLSSEPHTIWVWTGSDEGKGEGQAGGVLWHAGYLGTAAARRTLIGRRVGERFELTKEPGSRGRVMLPVSGLIAPLSPYDRLNEPNRSYKGRWYRAREWPQLDLEPQGYGPARAEIEILSVCRNAKRFHRTGVLRQRGYLLFGGPSSRVGVLHWGAIEASCPDPDGHVRIQVGPFYFFELDDKQRLMHWQTSYEHERPPWENLEEWEVSDSTFQNRVP
jgi:hypothetical protein